MGDLAHFDLEDLVTKHNLNAFVETGTYKGGGLRTAATVVSFEKIVSIDINPFWIKHNRGFAENDQRITLLTGPSAELLSAAIEIIKNRPTLWWLDAHLPETCTSLHGRPNFDGDQSFGQENTFPLEKELRIIVEAVEHDHSKDVFICDDLRIYEDGEFYHGNWKPEQKALYKGVQDNADFVFDFLEQTHIVTRDYRDHGYIIAKPKASC